MEEILDFAIDLVDEAAKISVAYFRTKLAIETKDGNFPVTMADREIENKLRNMIHNKYPNHGIIGEEFALKKGNSEYLWVIDPIDGTVAFATGKPTYTTLVALIKDGKSLFGIIDQPIQNERFVGITGENAYLNGKVIKTSSVFEFNNARLNATTPYMFTKLEMDLFTKLKQKVRICSWGGDAYAYGLLASGHIDIIMESELQYYDVAALEPIIISSGGCLTDWHGRPITREFKGQCIASANYELHQRVLENLSYSNV